MFYVNVILTIMAIYFANKEYKNNNIKMAMFWSVLLGWDLQVLLSSLL